jgi:hypothetical protein
MVLVGCLINIYALVGRGSVANRLTLMERFRSHVPNLVTRFHVEFEKVTLEFEKVAPFILAVYTADCVIPKPKPDTSTGRDDLPTSETF